MFDKNVLAQTDVISHSGVRIGGEKIIYIDPIAVSGAPHDADLILFTHPHFDHFSPKDARKLMKPDTVIAAPKSMAPMCRLLLQKAPVSLLPAQTYELSGMKVETVAAYNLHKPFHLKAMKWLGYILTIGETRVYISGDTDITPESKAVQCDIAMLPVGGGGYTVNAEQAAELAGAIMPHTAIPIHYGKLLGGADAAERFRAALDSRIEADIRPSACSNVMIGMYLKAAVLIVIAMLLGYAAGRLL